MPEDTFSLGVALINTKFLVEYKEKFHLNQSCYLRASVTRMNKFTASDKCFDNKKSIDFFFLFLHEDICSGNSLEVHHQGTSNEYPQHMF